MMMSLLVAATALHLPARMPSTRAAMCSRHALGMSASTSNSFLSWSECILEQDHGVAEQQSCMEKAFWHVNVNKATEGARKLLQEPPLQDSPLQDPPFQDPPLQEMVVASTNHAGEVLDMCRTFYGFVLHDMCVAPVFSLASSQVALAASQYKHALAKVTFARRPPDDEDEANIPSKEARRWLVVSTATASAALRRVLLT